MLIVSVSITQNKSVFISNPLTKDTYCHIQNKYTKQTDSSDKPGQGAGYFPCHRVVPVDFPINARYGRDFYTLTRAFPNQNCYNKSTYELVERVLSTLSFYRRYVKFKNRYSDVSKFRMIFYLIVKPF